MHSTSDRRDRNGNLSVDLLNSRNILGACRGQPASYRELGNVMPDGELNAVSAVGGGARKLRFRTEHQLAGR